MNRRVLSGVLVLGSTLATVGAAVSAEGSTGEEAESSLISSTAAEQFDDLSQSNQAVAKVPIRDGLLTDDIVDEAIPTPVEVRIGDIGLSAPILSVGVDENNQFDVPEADTVGWYEHSSLPGQGGATVLAAHVDYGGQPGAFFNLEDLRPGDPLQVVLTDGSVLEYRVTFSTEYQKTELPAEELFRKTGDSVLQLITCGGTFDPENRSYLANVVVTAVPETDSF